MDTLHFLLQFIKRVEDVVGYRTAGHIVFHVSCELSMSHVRFLCVKYHRVSDIKWKRPPPVKMCKESCGGPGIIPRQALEKVVLVEETTQCSSA